MASSNSSASSTAFPIRALHENLDALEIAIADCLADPQPRAVHKLRTLTRRIEALLELIALLPDLPPFRRKAAKLSRQLRKLRRAAGDVRDLDVQDRLIEETISEKTGSEDLRRHRKRLRKRAARALVELLTRRQTKLTRRRQALLDALESAEKLKLAPTALLEIVNTHFQSIHALIIHNPSQEHLHSIRKAAKLARYQAELAPASATAKRSAKQFKSLQEAGGRWHDWLELASAAAHELGDDHPAVQTFTSLCEQNLATFRSLIEDLRISAN